MAIKIDLATSQYGTPFNAVYFRIVKAAITRQRADNYAKFTALIDIAGYASAPGDDTREVAFRRYHADAADIEACDGTTFMDKCYTWVMTQDDMAGAEAV